MKTKLFYKIFVNLQKLWFLPMGISSIEWTFWTKCVPTFGQPKNFCLIEIDIDIEIERQGFIIETK